MSLFRLDTSIRREGSITREVADTVEAAWRETHPGGQVVTRDVGTEPLSPTLWALAATGGRTAADQRTPEQRDALAVAATVADELINAEAAVVGAPLYNFGVPQSLKGWIDFIITDPRLSPANPDKPLAGKPLVLVIARGGGYGAGTPREGWDHSTPYLLRIFRDVFDMDVHLVEAELTLADVNPAMEALRGKAAESRRDAHTAARTHGHAIAERVKADAA